MNFGPQLDDALSNGSLSLPLRYRIAQLLERDTPGSHDPIRPPTVQDHPRTRECVQVLRHGVRELPLHGYDSLESIIKVFSQHGIPRTDRWYKACISRMEDLGPRSPQFYRGIGRPGRILDDRRCGGSRLVRAASLARTVLPDESMIASEIAESVDVFKAVARVDRPRDLVVPCKSGFAVRDEMAMPSYYHLIVLAYTQSWRTAEAIHALRKAVGRLPLVPHAHLKQGSQLIAIAGLRGRTWFRPGALGNDIEKALWMDQMIALLRAEIIPPGKRSRVASVLQSVAGHWVSSIHSTGAFLKWGAYTGIALEADWKAPVRKRTDLLFRSAEMGALLQSQP